MDGQRTFALKALSALMLGALMGVMVGVPLDEMIGLSASLYSALQSLVATVTFAGLASSWPASFRSQ